jgi:hypothetical protein
MDPAYSDMPAASIDRPKAQVQERWPMLGTPYQTKLAFLANLLTFLYESCFNGSWTTTIAGAPLSSGSATRVRTRCL